MMLSCLLAATGLVPAAPTMLLAPAFQTAAARQVRDLDGQVIGTEDEVDTALGGEATNPFVALPSVRPVAARIFEITLKNTGTGWDELFIVGVPARAVRPSAPLLVVFHSYGRSPREITEETGYFDEALRRGWYVVAPLGAHKYNFSVPYARKNIEQVLAWARSRLPVDPERVYGVGFSMGGGGVLNYAATHLDPTHAYFAAIVNHTGTASVRDGYNHASDKSLFHNPLLFGGSPEQFPFAYQRSSVIDYDVFSSSIDQDTDLARNLSHLPVKIWAVDADPLQHLVDQSRQLDDQLARRGGAAALQIGVGNQHAWATIAESAVLDFLAPYRASMPGANQTVRTLAETDGRWLHFDVAQVQPGHFTPFTWNALTALNRMYVFQTENLASIAFRPSDLELRVDEPLELVLGSKDGEPVAVRLAGYAHAPTDVRRNGVSTPSWTYDSATGVLVLRESSSTGLPLWTVVP